MGAFFTLLYLVALFVSPPVLFGPFHVYHLELITAVLAFVTTLPNLPSAKLFDQTQTWAILTLWALIPISVALNTSMVEGIGSFYSFLPEIFAYFLTAVNFRTRRHYQLLVLFLVIGSVYFIVRGALDQHANVTPSLYLYGDVGLRRLRGLGVINDPNDFSQIMLSLIPCVFLFHRRKAFLNVFTIALPILLLLTGMFLAHSRGAAVGLMAVIILSARRRIGAVPAVVIAGALFAGALAFGWSGGRDVSVEAGSDRLDAWVMGIEFIKAHPILGIGKDRFGDLNYITAHNSIIQYAAENGFLGFTCWVLFLFGSLRMAYRITAGSVDMTGNAFSNPPHPDTPQNAWANMLAQSQTTMNTQPHNFPTVAVPIPVEQPMTEFQEMARLLILALTGFLTAGWFLSRALSPWMFMYGGMIVALSKMAETRGIVGHKDNPSSLLKWSVMTALGLLTLVYITLKVRSKLGQ